MAQRHGAFSGEPVDPGRPFVLSVEAAGGPRIAALNEAAEGLGLAVGQLLADARAKAGALQIRPADPKVDAAALDSLALWATRYAPPVAPWREENGADGFFIDVTGAAHLWNGERALLAHLGRRLRRFGLPARIAVADTPGAGWAMTRFSGRRGVVAPEGGVAKALEDLPIEALRLPAETRTALRRLGLKRVRDLVERPRAPLALRFGSDLLRRLDQALGRCLEPIEALVPPPCYAAIRQLLEPVIAQGTILAVAVDLMGELASSLEAGGAGAQTLRMSLYRVDGEMFSFTLGFSVPTRDVAHVERLLRLKLDRLSGAIDPGFGIEAIRLDVVTAVRVPDRQGNFASAKEASPRDRLAGLVDVVRNRVGPRAVRQLWPVASHNPERAVAAHDLGRERPAWGAFDSPPPRPIFLLSRAEPAEDVMAMVPDGPPQRFRWRNRSHRVAHAQGPERIAPEWWRQRKPRPARDYYVVEDEAGRRFWLFREGLYGSGSEKPRWFVHGLFA